MLFKQNPPGNVILRSFCVLAQFFQLFSEHAYSCPSAKLLWSPQGGCLRTKRSRETQTAIHEALSSHFLQSHARTFAPQNSYLIFKLGSSSVILELSYTWYTIGVFLKNAGPQTFGWGQGTNTLFPCLYPGHMKQGLHIRHVEKYSPERSDQKHPLVWSITGLF